MARHLSLAASLIITAVMAQQPGTLTPEVHPTLPSQKCTTDGGCVTVNTSIVLDASFRNLHQVNGTAKCIGEGFNTTLCPDVESCAKNCAVEGVDYSSYGIQTKGDALTLNLFTHDNNVTATQSPRVYLLANETTYDMLMLLNQEFTYDVDVSLVPCGMNGALYLSEMEATGYSSDLNKAGAKYGTGYCDAQCPKQTFIQGEANLNSTFGACCNEMDIWEANSEATAFTPHACNITGTFACTGADCGSNGVCDESGCDFNAYKMGSPDFYGPNKTIDTTRKFTVITQFFTSDGTATGELTTISRKYVQDGQVISNANVSIPGMASQNSISDDYCNSEVETFGGISTFERQGGMSGMGRALSRGMVLVFSIWMDSGSGMLWLDGTYPTTANASTPGVVRGPCSATSGNTTALTAMYPDAAVTFSAIKVGDIGSTFSAA